jgi:hypothetical protein
MRPVFERTRYSKDTRSCCKGGREREKKKTESETEGGKMVGRRGKRRKGAGGKGDNILGY